MLGCFLKPENWLNMFFKIIMLERKIKMSLSDTCLTQLCCHLSVQMKELLPPPQAWNLNIPIVRLSFFRKGIKKEWKLIVPGNVISESPRGMFKVSSLHDINFYHCWLLRFLKLPLNMSTGVQNHAQTCKAFLAQSEGAWRRRSRSRLSKEGGGRPGHCNTQEKD